MKHKPYKKQTARRDELLRKIAAVLRGETGEKSSRKPLDKADK